MWRYVRVRIVGIVTFRFILNDGMEKAGGRAAFMGHFFRKNLPSPNSFFFFFFFFLLFLPGKKKFREWSIISIDEN